MYIMKMRPVFKDYIWGGSRLRTEYNKQTDLPVIAESWELSCHPNGQSIIDNGDFAGQTLDFVIQNCNDFLGLNCEGLKKFPVLIKLIDAESDLSIQVHPDDEFAYEIEGLYGQGKTEAWIILDCTDGAALYYGLNRTVTEDELKSSISDGSILELLNKIEVKKGDVFLIDPGTIHALGAGIVAAEVQKNSDLTYRLYDYNRHDENGKPRPLHIMRGAKCADLEQLDINDCHNESCSKFDSLLTCENFTIYRLYVDDILSRHVGDDSFKALLFIDGEGVLTDGDEQLNFIKGDCFFIPAGFGEYIIQGKCKFLEVGV